MDTDPLDIFRIARIGHRRHQKMGGGRFPFTRRQVLIGLPLVLLIGVVFRTQIVLIGFFILSVLGTPFLPSIHDSEALRANQSTVMYDRTGGELYTIHGEENRFEVPLEKMPLFVRTATIAAEDDQFYEHPGFDVDGLIAAVLSEMGIGRPRGGSTITQQFVKNAYLSSERTWGRKLTELLMAVKLETGFSKDEILEMYLNRIPYGSNAYGVQAAALTFFGKNAEDLTVAESTVLAALPQAPTRYSPYGANKADLMGACVTGEEQVSFDTEVLTLVVEPEKRVWISVTADGKKVKEWTGSAGEKVELSFREKVTIRRGDGAVTLFVNGARLLEQEGRTIELARETVETMLAPEALAALQTALCSSPDDPRYVPGRTDYVLRRMEKLGYLTHEEALAAWREKNALVFQKYRERIRAPHFVFYVRELLEQKYGKDIVERGGLRVFTTLDPVLQDEAEKLVAGAFPHGTNADGQAEGWKMNQFGAQNAAVLSTDTRTGEILAMVGSRDYFEKKDEAGKGNDGAVNLTVRPRQPGSSFKPIVYAAGFEAGYAPGTVLWDVETEFGAEKYTPQNFEGGFQGPMTIRRALGGSRNIPAVKMAILVGEQKVVEFARKLGFTSLFDDGRYGPTIGLGAGEVTMLEMARAYAVFGNGGVLIEPTPILKVTDSDGNVLDEYVPSEAAGPQVMSEVSAYLMADTLSDPLARPAGWNAYLTLPDRRVAAKTGTSNKRVNANLILPQDAWTASFSPQVTTVVWMGNNDGTPMNQSASGFRAVGQIWQAYMKKAHEGREVLDFAEPPGVVTRSISRYSGLLAGASTPAADIVREKFALSAVPLEYDQSYYQVEVDTVSGKRATEQTPLLAREMRYFLNIHSERPNNSDWEKGVRAWMAGVKGDEGGAIAFGVAPTEYDDVHTASAALLAPRVAITAPAGGGVSAGSALVVAEVRAAHGVKQVEFYRGDQLVATVTKAPYQARVLLPAAGSVQLRVRVVDALLYEGEAVGVYTIGGGSAAAEATVTGLVAEVLTPAVGQEIVRGEGGIPVLVDAVSESGGVSVKVLWNGREVANMTSAPYMTTVPVRSEARVGKHVLTVVVTDAAGRREELTREFVVVEGGGVPEAAAAEGAAAPAVGEGVQM